MAEVQYRYEVLVADHPFGPYEIGEIASTLEEAAEYAEQYQKEGKWTCIDRAIETE